MGGAVGVVPLESRLDLPLVDLHGEPMFVHSVRALLGAPGVDRVVVTVGETSGPAVERTLARIGLRVDVTRALAFWQDPPTTGLLVLADPLCPLVPADFVARVVAAADRGDDRPAAVAGYRPVTDTVKTVVDQQIVGTLDRDRLAVVASPVALPAHLLSAGPPPVHDFGLLAAWLRERGGLELLRAPSMARRVGDESALRVLECLDELGRRVHEA